MILAELSFMPDLFIFVFRLLFWPIYYVLYWEARSDLICISNMKSKCFVATVESKDFKSERETRGTRGGVLFSFKAKFW